MVIILQPNVAHEYALKVFTASEMVAAQHLFDTAVEALDHAVGLRPQWSGRAILNTQRLAQLVKRMPRQTAMNGRTRGWRSDGQKILPKITVPVYL
jgi:hypothetical protein